MTFLLLRPALKLHSLPRTSNADSEIYIVREHKATVTHLTPAMGRPMTALSSFFYCLLGALLQAKSLLVVPVPNFPPSRMHSLWEISF